MSDRQTPKSIEEIDREAQQKQYQNQLNRADFNTGFVGYPIGVGDTGISLGRRFTAPVQYDREDQDDSVPSGEVVGPRLVFTSRDSKRNRIRE